LHHSTPAHRRRFFVCAAASRLRFYALVLAPPLPAEPVIIRCSKFRGTRKASGELPAQLDRIGGTERRHADGSTHPVFARANEIDSRIQRLADACWVDAARQQDRALTSFS
jgi:hypothetical protein